MEWQPSWLQCWVGDCWWLCMGDGGVLFAENSMGDGGVLFAENI
jgi:hypothetical protein